MVRRESSQEGEDAGGCRLQCPMLILLGPNIGLNRCRPCTMNLPNFGCWKEFIADPEQVSLFASVRVCPVSRRHGTNRNRRKRILVGRSVENDVEWMWYPKNTRTRSRTKAPPPPPPPSLPNSPSAPLLVVAMVDGGGHPYDSQGLTRHIRLNVGKKHSGVHEETTTSPMVPFKKIVS